jgi:hypothetical protein
MLQSFTVIYASKDGLCFVENKFRGVIFLLPVFCNKFFESNMRFTLKMNCDVPDDQIGPD